MTNEGSLGFNKTPSGNMSTKNILDDVSKQMTLLASSYSDSCYDNRSVTDLNQYLINNKNINKNQTSIIGRSFNTNNKNFSNEDFKFENNQSDFSHKNSLNNSNVLGTLDKRNNKYNSFLRNNNNYNQQQYSGNKQTKDIDSQNHVYTWNTLNKRSRSLNRKTSPNPELLDRINKINNTNHFYGNEEKNNFQFEGEEEEMKWNDRNFVSINKFNNNKINRDYNNNNTNFNNTTLGLSNNNYYSNNNDMINTLSRPPSYADLYGNKKQITKQHSLQTSCNPQVAQLDREPRARPFEVRQQHQTIQQQQKENQTQQQQPFNSLQYKPSISIQQQYVPRDPNNKFHQKTISEITQPEHQIQQQKNNYQQPQQQKQQQLEEELRSFSPYSGPSNNWTNVTAKINKTNFNQKHEGPMNLVPIGVQEIESYKPRLTLQDNNTTLSRLRSRSLARRSSNNSRDPSNGRFETELRQESPPRNPQKENETPWYLPHLSREEVFQLLREKPVGSFVVRKSLSVPGCFTLALKANSSFNDSKISIRNFLLEVGPSGAKLKNSRKEKEFVNLKALIDYHCYQAGDLPCKLIKTDFYFNNNGVTMKNVQPIFHIHSLIMHARPYQGLVDLFGMCHNNRDMVEQTEIKMDVKTEGIFLCGEKDSKMEQLRMMRRGLKEFYPRQEIVSCLEDTEGRSWLSPTEDIYENLKFKLFGFVSRSEQGDLWTHVFASNEEKSRFLCNLIGDFVV